MADPLQTLIDAISPNNQATLEAIANNKKPVAASTTPTAPASAYDAMLLSLNTDTAASGIPTAPTSALPPSTAATAIQAMTDQQVAGYRAVLQKAYPDQQISVNYDPHTGGLSGDIGGPATPAPTTGYANPNFQTGQLGSALDAMKSQLETATDPAVKMNLALNLKRMAMDQGVYNYNEFKSQAEARFGINDMETAINRVKQQEALDPSNPGNGIPSDQRMFLLQKLGEARTAARGYITEMVEGDGVTKSAINLADSVLAQFKLSDDAVRLQQLTDTQASQNQIKTDLLGNPQFLDRVAALTAGVFKPTDATRTAFATDIASGKMKVPDDIRMLANASQDQLYSALFNSKINPAMQTKIKTLLYSDELKATGDETTAKANMAILDKITSSDLDSVSSVLNMQNFPGMQQIQKQRKQQIAQKAQELTRQSATPTERNVAMADIDVAVKKQLLQIVSNARFMSDVHQWQGMVQADPVAQTILKQLPADKPVEATDFINRYVNAKGQTAPLGDRITALKQIISTAALGASKGSLLMNPNPDSLMMQVDKQASAAVISPYRTGSFGLDLFTMGAEAIAASVAGRK